MIRDRLFFWLVWLIASGVILGGWYGFVLFAEWVAR